MVILDRIDPGGGSDHLGTLQRIFKMAVGLAALLIAVVGTCIIGPPLAGKVSESNIRTAIEDKVNTYVQKNITGNLEELVKTTQDESIDSLPLPKIVTKMLKENNTLDKYKELEVENFREYLCRYLTQMIIYAAVYTILFVVILIAAYIVFYLMDIVAKIPGVHGANQLAGAAMGFAQALVYVWVFFLIITAYSSKDWASTCLGMVKDSQFLSIIYDNNLLLRMILHFIK